MLHFCDGCTSVGKCLCRQVALRPAERRPVVQLPILPLTMRRFTLTLALALTLTLTLSMPCLARPETRLHPNE
jgi:hypothetical protein